jgi:hypothetical protein
MVLFLFETKGAVTGLRYNGKEQGRSDIQVLQLPTEIRDKNEPAKC